MLWDIFCRVIDNHGDLGVCWRLAADLAARGHTVRLWVDDASALHWMAPGALEGRHPCIQVLPWAHSHNPDLLAARERADVWVEGFGCEIAPEFIAHYVHLSGAEGTKHPQMPIWINLEYLSAERYVARCHGLPSPVLHGPAQGGTKHFFYPGFTPETGGLLREPDLLARQHTFAQPGAKAQWLANQGVAWKGERLVSLFCYEPGPLGAWLAAWARDATPTQVLVCAGRAAAAVQAVLPHLGDGGATTSPRTRELGALTLHFLPYLSQGSYDELLWACDLNCVRGEDSLVRALWAGKPLLWHIYPQDDDAHLAKLDAFLDWLDAPASLRAAHHAWNGHDAASVWTDLPTWAGAPALARENLLAQDDLTTQLLRFVQGFRAKKQ